MNDFATGSSSTSSIQATLQPTVETSNPIYDQLPQGIPILDKGYSLEPDMMFGWQPKLKYPGPVPIRFQHDVLDTIVEELGQKPRPYAELVYLGPRLVDTLEVHECYATTYPFKFEHLYPSKFQSLGAVIKKQRKDLKREVNRPFLGMKSATDVQFDSHFESGNLEMAIKVGPWEYDLFMRVDTNTRGHFSWYYFKVSHVPVGQKVTFNICNFTKQRCLYERGMRPFMLSEHERHSKGKDWAQSGDNVRFQARGLTYAFLTEHFPNLRKFYRLSFEVTFKHENDTISFAYGVPYTFSKLTAYLKTLESEPGIHIRKFGQSLSGLDVPMIVVGNPTQRNIIVSGRIHPGESNGSWMMQGFMDYVTSKEATHFKEMYVQIKIIPMINPDGVVIGNYRTGIAGRDLNRQFRNTDKLLYPAVQQLKELLKETTNIFAFLDFHGHSVKKNVFTYGPEFPIFAQNYLRCRVLPKLLSDRTNMFRYWSGVWRVSKSKRTTSRAVFYPLFNIAHCFTVEASNGSFYCSDTKITTEFEPHHWVEMGYMIGEALYELVKMEIQLEEYEEQRKKRKLRKKVSEPKLRRQLNSDNEDDSHSISKSEKGKNKQGVKYDSPKRQPEMLRFMKVIKQEEESHQQEDEEVGEGRSDSESSEDDVNDDHLSKLKHEILQRQTQLGRSRNLPRKNHRTRSTSKRYGVGGPPNHRQQQQSCLLMNKNEVQAPMISLSMVGQERGSERRRQHRSQVPAKKQSIKITEEQDADSNELFAKRVQHRPNSQHIIEGHDLMIIRPLQHLLQHSNMTAGIDQRAPLELKQDDASDSRSYPLNRPRITRNQLNNIAYKPREKMGVFNYEYPVQTGHAAQGTLINSKATILEIIAQSDLISRKYSHHVGEQPRDKSESKLHNVSTVKPRQINLANQYSLVYKEDLTFKPNFATPFHNLRKSRIEQPKQQRK